VVDDRLAYLIVIFNSAVDPYYVELKIVRTRLSKRVLLSICFTSSYDSRG